MANLLLTVRKTFDANGMTDKKVGYTTRFNAFWDDDTRPDGYMKFATDGEGLDIDKELQVLDQKSLSDVVDWINIMLYDELPTDVGGKSTGIDLEQYQVVFDHFASYEHKDKIVMGFEPGNQAAGGIWEGAAVDEQVVNYV